MPRKTQENPLRIAGEGLLVFFLFSVIGALVQNSATKLAQTASPERVGWLTKALSIGPAQASGGAGALFGPAKRRLTGTDFGKLAAVKRVRPAPPAVAAVGRLHPVTKSRPRGRL